MQDTFEIIDEIPKVYRVIKLRTLRRMGKTAFDYIPLAAIAHIDALDRVLHQPGAYSPATVGDVQRPWYMHQHQEDNLVVLHGTRYIDLYHTEHGKVESFVVTPHRIEKDGHVLYDGSAMLVWPCNVFHRVISCEKEGSASLNLAVHHEGFDIRTNFSVYDLDPQTGEYTVIREGHLDQPS